MDDVVQQRTKCPDCDYCLNCPVSRCNLCRAQKKKSEMKKCCKKEQPETPEVSEP
ncbi:MAG: hypothetical protein HZA77_02980 [Candidatus Schekmanbacteria bacterium]|nr:hypothetical protein [Candidatus Schekmanbacteria bacterium]